jgi:ribonuclease D
LNYIDTFQDLESFCKDLADADGYCIDTEFIRERNYYPELCLVQLRAVRGTEGAEAAVIDTIAIDDLTPLLEILLRKEIPKILHSCEQDLAIFFQLTGEILPNIFDVQLAASLTGYGHMISYARIVQAVLQETISKTERFTRWNARPLTDRQLEYAIADVEHLPKLYQHLQSELAKHDRSDWYDEELGNLLVHDRFAPNPREQYKKVKGAARLSRRRLAILRELADWRLDMAQYRDVPRSAVLSDQALIELATSAPKEISRLKNLRAIKPNTIDRDGYTILDVVAAGEEIPEDEHPPSMPRSEDSRYRDCIPLIETGLELIAGQLHIARQHFGTRTDINEFICAWYDTQDVSKTPLGSGWRGDLLADRLIALLEGKTAVRIQPKTHALELYHCTD